MSESQLALTRILFSYAGRCCPRLFARWGIYLWGKTTRPVWRDWEQVILAAAKSKMLSGQNSCISTYCWGSGPKRILLLPGWNSRASHFRNFVEPLTSKGYEVVGMDPPGHGLSSGNRSNIRQYLQAIEAVHQHYGHFHAVIGHSFGGFCIPFALNSSRLATRAVLLATPVSLQWLFTRFCNIIQATPVVRRHMELETRQLLGDDCWANFDIPLQARNLSGTPALILHDVNDTGVPAEHARKINASWPRSRLLLTHNLGHQRILRHPSSVKAAIEFIAQD